MPKLERTPAGGFKARQRIPNDVAAEYQRLYGPRHEAKFSLPPGTSEGDAKLRHAQWRGEVAARFRAIRASLNGEGQDLTQVEADRLTGEWYEWWTARHSAPSDDWLDHVTEQVRAALEYAAGEELPARVGGDPWEVWKRHDDVRPKCARPLQTKLTPRNSWLAKPLC